MFDISNLSQQERIELLKQLKAAGLQFGQIIEVYGTDEANPYVTAAAEASDEGLILDPTPVVSEGEEGAYVLMWKWISNQTAGVMLPSDLLEQVLIHARKGIADSKDLQPEIRREREVMADWLDDLIMNLMDEIDDIETAPIKGLPHSITWHDGDDKPWTFMPSDAINQLRLLARQGGLPDHLADKAEQFSIRFGNKLDAALTVLHV